MKEKFQLFFKKYKAEIRVGIIVFVVIVFTDIVKRMFKK
jgi:hypothetical protein